MENNIPSPNPYLTGLLVDPINMGQNVLVKAGELCRDVYQATVAKRSGALAASANVSRPFLWEEGRSPRLAVDLIVGQGTPRGGYGAAHEFGIGIHPRSRVPPTEWMPQDPVDDLVKVLAIVDSLP